MHCSVCGFEIEDGQSSCSRCGLTVENSAAAGEIEDVKCPSCSALNHIGAEYCATCGSPMAIITRVLTMSRARTREALESWRVYGIETTMFGRTAELQSVMRAHHEVCSERKLQHVTVTGPTGLGKTRLIAEFVRRLEKAMSETLVYQGESRDEAAIPYIMFERMLKARFYIGDREAPETTRRKLLEACNSLVGSAEGPRVAHLVGQLMDVTFEDSPYLPSIRDTEDAAELDRKAIQAFEELLIADAKQNPLLLVFEDLQYAPNQALSVLEQLQKGLSNAPVLLLYSWNPDELPAHHPLRGGALSQANVSIELAPLSDHEVEQFVYDTLRKVKDIPTALVERITEAAHGNPLIVEEFLRTLISQGLIDTRLEQWRVDERGLNGVKLPQTVEGAVQARLQSLNEDEQRIMGMAACVGQTFWPECVHALFHVHEDFSSQTSTYWKENPSDHRVDAWIESLERKDMIRRSDESPFGYEQMYFKHRIEQRSIYDTLSSQEKQRYHRIVAQWMLHHFGESPVHLELIAGHFEKGRALNQAASLYETAASQARLKYDIWRAIVLLQKSISCASDSHLELKLRTFFELGNLYTWLGDHDLALEQYHESLRHAWILNDRAEGGLAYNKLGRAYRSLGDYERALTHFEFALNLFRSFDDTPGIASTLDDIGHIHWVRGNFEEAKNFFTAGLHLRREVGVDTDIALSLSHLGSVVLQQGDLKVAMLYFREALELRKAADDKQGVVDSFNNLGCLLLERGDVDGARTLLEEALEIALSIGYRGSLSVVQNNLGELHLSCGQTREARQHLEAAISVAEQGGEKRVLFDILKNLALLELRETNRPLALERIHDALQIANELESDQLIGLGMLALADVHAEAIFDPLVKEESSNLALSCYAQAEEMFSTVGNDAELAKSLSRHGKLLMELGQMDAGREKLEAANAIFNRLEMREFARNTRSMIDLI